MNSRNPEQIARVDQSLYDGRIFPSGPIEVIDGDTVGLVLLVPGTPENDDQVLDYLYQQYMDPVNPVTPFLRPLQSVVNRFRASRRARPLRAELEAVGGGAALNMLAREQAACLSGVVERRMKHSGSVSLRSYVAARYGPPSFSFTISQMMKDGVTKVVLVPVFPQYGGQTTGSALASWRSSTKEMRAPDWITTCIREYATESGYIEALSDRIDQALQRFPRSQRNRIHFLFVARGGRFSTLRKKNDPYCCLLHQTIEEVGVFRDEKRDWSLAYLNDRKRTDSLEPTAKDAVESLARTGTHGILAIPIDYVSDQLDTAYGLDVALRGIAAQEGIDQFRVVSGLNCHPSLMKTLSSLVLDRIQEGAAASGTPLRGSMEYVGTCPYPGPTDASRVISLTRCLECPFSTSADEKGRRSVPTLKPRIRSPWGPGISLRKRSAVRRA